MLATHAPLTDRQQRFVDAYTTPRAPTWLNATRSAEAAGYPWPSKQGPRLRRSPAIADAITARLEPSSPAEALLAPVLPAAHATSAPARAGSPRRRYLEPGRHRRRDLRTLRRAVREAWPIPAERRPELVAEVAALIEGERRTDREAFSAVRTLLAMDLADQRTEHAAERIRLALLHARTNPGRSAPPAPGGEDP
jgi:hypothetical protein